MLESSLIQNAAVFVLVLGRIGGLVATAPVYSGQTMPRRVRALLAIALTMVVLPTQLNRPSVFASDVSDVPRFAMMVGLEVVVGMLLGLGVMILLSGVQAAGQVVAQVSGMSLGDVFNPGLDDNISIFSQLFYFVTLAAFVAIGGHRMMMEALLGTFEWSPPGSATFGQNYVAALVGLLAQSFELGVRAAAPLLIALFLSTVVLGLISRTLPQINTVAVGFSVNALVTLSIMFLSLGGVVYTFQAPVDDALKMLIEVVGDADGDVDETVAINAPDFSLAPSP